jgi:acylphosphatase
MASSSSKTGWPEFSDRRFGDCETSVWMTAASRCRMCVLYSGHVQGVGFRYMAKAAARGFEVTGTVRNLPDGRVELIAEGQREELDAFRHGVREAGLEHFIRDEVVTWGEALGGFRGFEIVR